MELPTPPLRNQATLASFQHKDLAKSIANARSRGLHVDFPNEPQKPQQKLEKISKSTSLNNLSKSLSNYDLNNNFDNSNENEDSILFELLGYGVTDEKLNDIKKLIDEKPTRVFRSDKEGNTPLHLGKGIFGGILQLK